MLCSRGSGSSAPVLACAVCLWSAAPGGNGLIDGDGVVGLIAYARLDVGARLHERGRRDKIGPMQDVR